jgi:hypothetical protein
VLQLDLWLVTLVSELDNFDTARAKSAFSGDRAFFYGGANIYNSNEKFCSINGV